jgi:hypothetical protein
LSVLLDPGISSFPPNGFEDTTGKAWFSCPPPKVLTFDTSINDSSITSKTRMEVCENVCCNDATARRPHGNDHCCPRGRQDVAHDVIPTIKSGDGENPVLSTPLSSKGTPEEIDAELGRELAGLNHRPLGCE